MIEITTPLMYVLGGMILSWIIVPIFKRLKRWYWNNREDSMLVAASSNIGIRGHDFPNPLRFSIQQASGGTIVDVSTYDRRKDEHGSNMHVIPEGHDVAEAIGQIVTMEMLRR